MEISDFKVEQMSVKVVLRSVTMRPGALSVTVLLAYLMEMLPVDNWALLLLVGIIYL